MEGPYDLDIDDMLAVASAAPTVSPVPAVAVSADTRGGGGEMYGDLPAALRHHSRHLSTITEQYSPYGTEMSRKVSAYPPTAEAVFKQGGLLAATVAPALSPSTDTSGPAQASESDEPYYPMGSEMSARPTTPRFVIEEVSDISNYEPIMVSRDASTSSSQVKVNKC